MKRIVMMQDLSCFGKCSMTVILPVISAMGVECGVLPTAVLSTHTAFANPAVLDLTEFAQRTLDHWSTLNPRFDGVLTGYLASARQAELAKELMDRNPEAFVIVDPAMADHGRLYAGLEPEMIPAMARLCRRADLCLPNLTEGALMAGIPWEDRADPEYCRKIARGLLAQGCRAVMLTGAEPEPGQVGYFYRDGTREAFGAVEKLPRACHGTGDLFAAVVAGAVMRGLSPEEGGSLAMELIRAAMAATPEDSRGGVAFEPELGHLARKTDALCAGKCSPQPYK